MNKELKDTEVIQMTLYPKGRYRDKAPDNFLVFQELLPIKIEKVESKGKLIYFVFQNNFFLLNTLGMSGYWSFNSEKHTCVKLTYIKNKKEKSLYFNDQRHFGTLKFLRRKSDLNDKLKEIGPDMLNDPDKLEHL